MPADRTTRSVWVVLGCAEVAAVCVAIVLIPFSIDMEVYRLGAQALVRGNDIYGTLPPTSAGIGLPFIYPPLAAIAFTPLTLLGLATARIVFALVSVAALGVTLYCVARHRLARSHAITLALAVLVAAAFLEPVRETLLFGQVNTVLMAMVAVDCLALRNTRYRGVLTGLAAALKLTPAVFVLFWLLRRDKRGTLQTVGAAVAATALGFAVTPGNSWTYWRRSVTEPGSMYNDEFAGNQNIKGAIARLLPDSTLGTVLWALAALAVLALAVAAMRRALRADMVTAALLVNAIAGLLISPVSWSHHWVWVAPALLVLGMATWQHRDRVTAWGTAALAVAFYIGPMWFAPSDQDRELAWTWYQHVYGNAYTLLAIAALAVVTVRLRAPGPPQLQREPERSAVP